MTQRFNATSKQKLDISVEALAEFIEKYVAIQFPTSDIDHWEKSNNPAELNSQIPGLDGDNGFLHSMCSVYTSEGTGEQIIAVSIMLKDGDLQPIAYAKSSGEAAQNWAVAQAVTEVIETLYHRQELPLIVDFAEAISSKPLKTEGKSIYFLYNPTSLDIEIDNKVMASYDFSGNDEVLAKLNLKNYLRDWSKLSKNMGMIINEREKDVEIEAMSPA